MSKNSKTRRSFTVLPMVNIILAKQLAKDAKTLAIMSFDDLPAEDEWVAIQTETTK